MIILYGIISFVLSRTHAPIQREYKEGPFEQIVTFSISYYDHSYMLFRKYDSERRRKTYNQAHKMRF